MPWLINGSPSRLTECSSKNSSRTGQFHSLLAGGLPGEGQLSGGLRLSLLISEIDGNVLHYNTFQIWYPLFHRCVFDTVPDISDHRWHAVVLSGDISRTVHENSRNTSMEHCSGHERWVLAITLLSVAATRQGWRFLSSRACSSQDTMTCERYSAVILAYRWMLVNLLTVLWFYPLLVSEFTFLVATKNCWLYH